jgi:uncharacterized protein involved in exopolysaccharide biosynthesis
MKISKLLPPVLRPLYRGLPVVIVFMVVAVSIAGRYLRYVTPTYESTTFIKLADNHDGASGTNLFRDFDVFATSNKISAEVELLKSGVLLEKAAKSIDLNVTVSRIGKINTTELYKNSPVMIVSRINNAEWVDRIFSLSINANKLTIISPDGKTHHTTFGQQITTSGGDILIVKNSELLATRPKLQIDGSYEFTINSINRQKEMIRSQLDVMSVDKEVPVLRISCRSAVPEKAADMANAVAMAYLNDFVETKFSVADTTKKFLDKQLESYGQRLSNSEDNIELYRDTNNIINIRQETETDLRKIADLKKQLISVQMSLSAVDSLHAAVSKGVDRFLELAPNFEQFTDLLSTEIVLKIKALQAEKKELLIRYTPEHEKVRLTDAKMEDLILYLRESISNSKTALQIKRFELEQGIRDAEAVFIGLPGRERKMNDLERDFSLNEQLYRFLHEKKTEAEIAQAARIAFHRIITVGDVPNKPVSPNTGLIKIISGLLGLLAAVTLIYIVHFQKARVNDADTFQRTTAQPLDTSIPFTKTAAEKQHFFRKWFVELELRNVVTAGKVIVISSTKSGEGKCYTAASLAAAAASAGYSVLLADTDGKISAGDIPSGVDYVNAAGLREIQSKETLLRLMDSWKKSANLIIWKNAEADFNPDALNIMAAADTNFFLADSRITKRAAITAFDLRCSELKLPGTAYVLNRSDYTPSLIREVLLVSQKLAGAVFQMVNKFKTRA